MATADEVLITVRTAGVKAAGADIDRTRKKLEGLGRAARGVGKDLRRTTRDLERLTSAASELSVADALGASSGGGRRAGSGGIENARASLARMRSDVGKTNALLRQMELRGPKRSPFAVSEIVGSARQLQGFNRAAERTVGAMRAVRGSANGSGGGSSAGTSSGIGGQRLDRPTGAPGRAASPGRRARRGPHGQARTDSRANARTSHLDRHPANGPSLAAPPSGTKNDSERQRTMGDAWSGLREPFTKSSDEVKGRIYKERDKAFGPAVVTMLDNAKNSLLKGDVGGALAGLPRDGEKAWSAFKDMSTGGQAVTVGGAIAGWKTKKAVGALKDRAKVAAKKAGTKALATTMATAVTGGFNYIEALKKNMPLDRMPKRPVLKPMPVPLKKPGILQKTLGKVGNAASDAGKFAWKHKGTVGKAAKVGVRFAGPVGVGISAGLMVNDLVGMTTGRSLSDRTLGGSPIPTSLPSAPVAQNRPPATSLTPYPPKSQTQPVRNLQPVAQPVRNFAPVAQPVRSLAPVAQPVAKRTRTAVRPRIDPRFSAQNHGGLKFLSPKAKGGTVGPGELTLVGERGPEIARFPAGTQITSNRDTRARAAGASSATRGRAQERVVRETPLNLFLDGQAFYRAVSRQTELAELRG